MSILKNSEAVGNKTTIPSAYQIKHIKLLNHKGEDLDIQNIVVRTTITESLYSPTLILKLGIKDSTNLFETHSLMGQEIIQIKMDYINHKGEQQDLDLEFYVTEYPDYGRTDRQENTQVFTIGGISKQAYISNLKRISRSFNNNPVKEIKQIFKSVLLFPENKFITDAESSGQVKGIITYQSPFAACEWLRKMSYDINFAPFYLYQTLDGNMNLNSLSGLLNGTDTPKEYIKATLFSGSGGDETDAEERSKRIISAESKLGLSKLKQAKNGAWGSRAHALDLSRKSFTNEPYSYNSDYKKNISLLPGNSALSSEFLIEAEPLEKFPHAHEQFLSTNVDAFDGVLKNCNDSNSKSRLKQNAYNSVIDTYTHDVKLFGDFQLNPGKVINLKFPKAIDASIDNTTTDLFDNNLSGDCLITSVVHRFEDGEYYSHVRCKKDVGIEKTNE